MVIAQRWLPLAPPGLHRATSWQIMACLLLEDAGSPLGIPWGAQLDLSSMGSMQVVITHEVP